MDGSYLKFEGGRELHIKVQTPDLSLYSDSVVLNDAGGVMFMGAVLIS